jgi:anti-sigma factor RsiW
MSPIHPNTPITEADLHAYVDGQLTAVRQAEVESWLASRPEEAARVAAYVEQKEGLHALLDPVLDEALPQRVREAAARPRRPWYLQQLAASFAIALVSGTTGWGLHVMVAGGDAPVSVATGGAPQAVAMASAAGFAQRAAVAHVVYSPDQRRPVEVDAAHEDELVAWLSKRMGAPMKPPHLQALGYSLEGGRLLPGGRGPVAQFMYRDAAGGKLTLYVSNEVADPSAPGKNSDSAFRFAEQGPIKVFYWVDGPFGYAISADADAQSLTRVSTEVYRQLTTSAGGR